ncbi:MAG: hypothetical protein ACJ71L_02725 [Nitrososphaeraceae archaeon]
MLRQNSYESVPKNIKYIFRGERRYLSSQQCSSVPKGFEGKKPMRNTQYNFPISAK